MKTNKKKSTPAGVPLHTLKEYTSGKKNSRRY